MNLNVNLNSNFLKFQNYFQLKNFELKKSCGETNEMTRDWVEAFRGKNLLNKIIIQDSEVFSKLTCQLVIRMLEEEDDDEEDEVKEFGKKKKEKRKRKKTISNSQFILNQLN